MPYEVPVSSYALKRVSSTAVAPYVFYAIGNALALRLPIEFSMVADPTGKHRATMDILTNSARGSLLVTMPLVLMAWLRLHAGLTKRTCEDNRLRMQPAGADAPGLLD